MKRKAMTGSNGTMGGYTLSPEMKSCMKSIAEMGETGLAGAEGHSLHYHPETGEVHHSYPPDTDPAMHEEMRKGLFGIGGVSDVNHGPDEPPMETGFVKAYPMQEEEEPGDAQLDEPAEMMKAAKIANIKAMVNKMPYAALVCYGSVVKKSSKKIQDAVSRKIPKLVDEGMDPKRAVAAAFHMAGEKGMDDDDMMTKDATTGDTAADDAAAATDDAEVASDRNEVKHGGQCFQHLIDFIEGELPMLDNERATQYFTDLLEDARQEGAVIYPEVEFGGETKALDEGVKQGEEGAKPEERTQKAEEKEAEDEANDYQSGIKSYKPFKVKRLARRVCGVIKGVCDHLGEMAEKDHGEPYRRSEKSMCMKCFKDLSNVHMELSGMDSKQMAGKDDMDEGPNVIEKGIDLSALLTIMQDGVKKVDAVAKTVYEVTGKKV